MHALVVVSHPVVGSLSQSVARMIAAEIEALGHMAELADLAAERFDPRFGASDIAVFTDGAAPPPDFLAERLFEVSDAMRERLTCAGDLRQLFARLPTAQHASFEIGPQTVDGKHRGVNEIPCSKALA